MALAIPVSLTPNKWGRTFYLCFIFIKLSFTSYNWGATLAGKTAGRELRRAHEWLQEEPMQQCIAAMLQQEPMQQGYSTLGTNGVWMGVSRVLYDRRLYALNALFTTIKCSWNCECCIFIGQWDSLLFDLSREFRKKISHQFSSVCIFINYFKQ